MLPFFIMTIWVELTLMSAFVFDARKPGKACAGAVTASAKQAPSSAESENPATFIAREAIRFFGYSSVNRASYTRAMPGIPMRERLLRALADPAPELPLEGERVAAIALVLLERDGSLDALLIERAQREGDPWSGHIAMPGGKVEASDVSLHATAERETFEEVGLDLKGASERMGRLSDCAPARGVPIAVRPFVYLLAALPELTLNAEVRRSLWVPVGPLERGERRTTYHLSRAGQHIEFPAWDLEGSVVWGLTYRVLTEFLARFGAVSGEK